MGYFLSSGRDAGIMLHGTLADNRIYYAGGLFNHKGEGIGNRSDGRDQPEISARLVFAPFAAWNAEPIKNIQFGGSGAFARININELDFRVKTSGMAETNRNIYVLTHSTKFGVLQEVDDMRRIGAEAAWAWGSLAIQGEIIRLTYTSLKPVGNPEMDARFTTWYASAVYFVTGEQISFSRGTITPVVPNTPLNPAGGHFGAIGIAGRLEQFRGDDNWITPNTFVSVQKADAVSVAINWIINHNNRLILDYTRTNLSDPIRIRVRRDGAIDYIDEENTLTVRYVIDL
jgi:phosphate-selective porin OprO and OprP